MKEIKQNIFLVNKKEGELLSELVSRIRTEQKIPKNTPITYAGRLDPMAEGLVILLTGDAVHEKEEYLKLQKTYEVEMLFGVSSDTEDALGKISGDFIIPKFDEVQNVIEDFPKEYEQEYPMYSSKTVAGIPLFAHARNATAVEIPKHMVMIHKIIITDSKEISGAEICHEAIERIKNINGDFRQEEIIESWENFKNLFGEKKFLIVKTEVEVGSGTYMRTLSDDIAKSVGTRGIAWRIKRVKIGEFET